MGTYFPWRLFPRRPRPPNCILPMSTSAAPIRTHRRPFVAPGLATEDVPSPTLPPRVIKTTVAADSSYPNAHQPNSELKLQFRIVVSEFTQAAPAPGGAVAPSLLRAKTLRAPIPNALER